MHASLLYSLNFFQNSVIEVHFSLTWPQESQNFFPLLSLNLLESNDKLDLIFNLHVETRYGIW